MKYLLSILLWGALACNFLSAQKSKIDSLKRAIHIAETDSTKILAFKNVSWEYLNTHSNNELAKIYIDSVHQLSVASENKNGIAIANYQYGVLEL